MKSIAILLAINITVTNIALSIINWWSLPPNAIAMTIKAIDKNDTIHNCFIKSYDILLSYWVFYV